MLKIIKAMLGVGKSAKSDTKKPTSDREKIEKYEHRYPPFPTGIPAIALEEIIESQHDLIKQIIASKGLSGKHNQEKVQTEIMDTITHYAEWVHLLPASEKQYFRSPGGLFRFGLENALFAIRHAERSMLTRATPEIRKDTETLWTHASFLAGLVSESIRTLSRVSVYSDSGLSWHPGVEPLYQWLQNNNIQSYHLRWSEVEDRAMSVTVAGKTIPPEQAKFLSTGEKTILATLMSALYDLDDLSNPIAKINQSVRYSLIERDLAADSSRYGKPAAGMHLAPWLIDGMRHLLKTKRWMINDGIGRVWYGHDGVYLVWPLAAHDIRHELRESKSPFLPNTDEILAEIMLDSDIISNNGNAGGYTFNIGIPQLNSQELKLVEAVRLTRKEVLFGSVEHEPDNRSFEIREEGDHENNSEPEIKESDATPIPPASNVEYESAATPDEHIKNDQDTGSKKSTKGKGKVTTEDLFGNPSKPSKKDKKNNQYEDDYAAQYEISEPDYSNYDFYPQSMEVNQELEKNPDLPTPDQNIEIEKNDDRFPVDETEIHSGNGLDNVPVDDQLVADLESYQEFIANAGIANMEERNHETQEVEETPEKSGQVEGENPAPVETMKEASGSALTDASEIEATPEKSGQVEGENPAPIETMKEASGSALTDASEIEATPEKSGQVEGENPAPVATIKGAPDDALTDASEVEAAPEKSGQVEGENPAPVATIKGAPDDALTDASEVEATPEKSGQIEGENPAPVAIIKDAPDSALTDASEVEATPEKSGQIEGENPAPVAIIKDAPDSALTDASTVNDKPVIDEKLAPKKVDRSPKDVIKKESAPDENAQTKPRTNAAQLLSTSASPQNQKEAPKKSVENLFDELMATPPSTKKTNEVKSGKSNSIFESIDSAPQKKKDKRQNSNARAKMMMDMLREKVPPEFKSRPAKGITKIQTIGVTEVDIKDCLSELKAAGYLELVEGREIAVENGKGNKEQRYFLVKADLING